MGHSINIKNSLKTIGFTNLPCVLDAGFGMGQWTVPLSQQNSELHGIEFSNDRYEAVKIDFDLNITNAYIQQGSIENLPYEDNKFDAIFCYSVIFSLIIDCHSMNYTEC